MTKSKLLEQIKIFTMAKNYSPRAINPDLSGSRQIVDYATAYRYAI